MAATKDANIHAKINSEVKENAEAILDAIGIPRSVAIDMFYRQIIMHNGLPFPATLQQPVPARDSMTEEEFNMMMATGYKQAVEDISYAAEDVFEELKKGL